MVHDGFQNVVSSENATVAGTWSVSRRMELYECSTGSGTLGVFALLDVLVSPIGSMM